MKRNKKPVSLPYLKKTPTGIAGLDEVTLGGLPQGRPTLVCGGAGCGKTLLATEFLVRGATEFNEPGVFISFEEKPEELATNAASLGFNLNELIRQKKIAIDYVHLERSEIEETGAYNLEGLFVRLAHAIDSTGAKRVVLDTIENLFAGLSNDGILRAEIRRLFRWLKTKNVTAIVTGESGGREKTLTRHGLEEYISDCVIVLDHRVNDQISTRRLRIVKYRGSTHGTNEYPFLIDENGISVVPITSVGLTHKVTNKRISTGIEGLDRMFDGKGYYKGRSILVFGTAGTGKSSLAVSFVNAAAKRGEKCLYFAFEESEAQIVLNMRSIGMDLGGAIKKRLLQIHAARPTLHGLEMHLAVMHKLIVETEPDVVVVDPINNLTTTGNSTEVKAMLTRLIDFLKMKGISSIFTSLISAFNAETDPGISSLMDTVLFLNDVEGRDKHMRTLRIVKSRGMAHSHEVRNFIITNKGIEIK